MSDALFHIFNNILDECTIRDLDLDTLNNSRNKYSQIVREVRLRNKLVLENVERHDSIFPLQDPLVILLEIICFLSSIDLTISMLSDKKVLFIGSGYGIEVILMNLLGINVLGIEKDSYLHVLALSLKTKCSINDDVFINEDILNSSLNKKFDLIIARNLNPLADTRKILIKVKEFLKAGATALIQWDALYNEYLAIEQYAPKRGIYYNERLRNLLDVMYKEVLGGKKTRARFLYKVI